MRVSREKAAESRTRIVEAAARLFREKGIDGVGVDEIMQEAGLTHGGFYRHFASKEDLAVEAVAHAGAGGRAWQSAYSDIGSLVSGYLSERHRDRVGDGCVIAALGADASRHGGGARHELTEHIRAQLGSLADLFTERTATVKRKRAIAALSGMVGALAIARAVDDPALSKEILVVARDAFGKE